MCSATRFMFPVSLSSALLPAAGLGRDHQQHFYLLYPLLSLTFTLSLCLWNFWKSISLCLGMDFFYLFSAGLSKFQQDALSSFFYLFGTQWLKAFPALVQNPKSDSSTDFWVAHKHLCLSPGNLTWSFRVCGYLHSYVHVCATCIHMGYLSFDGHFSGCLKPTQRKLLK